MAQEIIKWDLTDFYKNIDDPAIDTDLKELEKSVEKFYQKVKGKLADPSLTPKQLLEWYQEYEKISEHLFYLDLYSRLQYSIKTFAPSVPGFADGILRSKIFLSEKRERESAATVNSFHSKPVSTEKTSRVSYPDFLADWRIKSAVSPSCKGSMRTSTLS